MVRRWCTRLSIRNRARVLIASGPKPLPCHSERSEMSIDACSYIGSVSSTHWMNPIDSPSNSITNRDSPSNTSSASATDFVGSPHHRATSGSLKISLSRTSSPARNGRSRTRSPVRTSSITARDYRMLSNRRVGAKSSEFAWLMRTLVPNVRKKGSGGEVDPDRAQALVEGFECELQDVAFGVAVIGDVARVGWVEGVGDQRQALDQRLLDDRGESRRVLPHGLLQHLDPEVDVPRLVASDGGESPIEAAIRRSHLAHRFQLEALAGQGERRLDDDVIERDALNEGLDVFWVARQTLRGRGQPVVEELVVALAGVRPDLLQQLGEVLGVGAHHLAPPTLEEHGVPRLV